MPFDELAIRCDICLDILYQPLTAIPCTHNFCAACLLQWNDTHPNCPRCVQPILHMLKSPFVHEVVDACLRSYPERTRTEQYCLDADLRELHLLEKRLLVKDEWPDEMEAYEDAQMQSRVAALCCQYQLPVPNGSAGPAIFRLDIREQQPRLQIIVPLPDAAEQRPEVMGDIPAPEPVDPPVAEPAEVPRQIAAAIVLRPAPAPVPLIRPAELRPVVVIEIPAVEARGPPELPAAEPVAVPRRIATARVPRPAPRPAVQPRIGPRLAWGMGPY